MCREDIIHILCRLKHYGDDYKTIRSYFLFELSDRKYEITFNRVDGMLINFEIQDIGPVLNENN